ncbi:MAG: hypothetical protein DRH90_22300 [Deltaproteobacteria bacterium]|nr:MAG: hypothetical protein DRH90_22300 [Deltaproteobacteria bacterium]
MFLRSVRPLPQSVCPLPQFVCPMSQFVCPMPQFVCPMPQFVCPMKDRITPGGFLYLPESGPAASLLKKFHLSRPRQDSIFLDCIIIIGWRINI